jgi:membrane dipeptidase
MNNQGILIDVAHASEPTVNGILEATNKPVILSHSHIAGEIQSPRFVSLALAQRIAEQDGIIGAWPAGIGAETLADFVNRVLQLVDAIGAEHVAIGTDLDANYKPVLTEYADFVALTAGLRQRGVKDAELAAILGGNFLRVLAASEAS